MRSGLNTNKKLNRSHQRQTWVAENIVIQWAHRVKKKGNSDSPRKPRTMLCRFLNYVGVDLPDKWSLMFKGKIKCYTNQNFAVTLLYF